MCDVSPLGALDTLVESYFGFFRKGSAEDPKFFSQGYGDLQSAMELRKSFLQEIRDGNFKERLDDGDFEWKESIAEPTITVQEGYFLSPLHALLPEESKYCRFHLVHPVASSSSAAENREARVYLIMLASTGEAGKKSRLAMAQELAEDYGYASIIVTSPYYGHRKPSGQPYFYLQCVSDLWKQFGATIREAAALAEYFCRTRPHSVACFTGFSAGGALAICSAWAAMQGYRMDGSRLGVAAYVAPASAGIYAVGSISCMVDWPALRETDQESFEVTKKRLYENLDLLSVSSITGFESESSDKAPSRRLGSIRFCAGTRDSFSPRLFARVLEEQLPPLATNCSIEWHPFGHVYAGLARPRLQKKLIIDTVAALI